jgi:hypothetical protein
VFVRGKILDIVEMLKQIEDDVTHLHIYCHSVQNEPSAPKNVTEISIPKTSNLRTLVVFSCLLFEKNSGFTVTGPSKFRLKLFFEKVSPDFHYQHTDGKKYPLYRETKEITADWLFDDRVSAAEAQKRLMKDFEVWELANNRGERLGCQIDILNEKVKPSPITKVPEGEFQQSTIPGAPGTFELEGDMWVAINLTLYKTN